MFASRVFPGAALVRATRRLVSALIRLDLPTLERPTSATSLKPSLGKSAALAALVTNAASIFTGQEGQEGQKDRRGLCFFPFPPFPPFQPFPPPNE